MPGHRITLTGEKQTLLITLYAKALDSRLDDSILHDRFAEEAVRQIDFDFSRVALGKGNERALAMRSHYFDQACREFLGRHPEGQVLNLGCGLDSRIYRVDPPAELPWFDLDYPEVMDLRERLTRRAPAPIGRCATRWTTTAGCKGCRASGPPWSWPRG